MASIINSGGTRESQQLRIVAWDAGLSPGRRGFSFVPWERAVPAMNRSLSAFKRCRASSAVGEEFGNPVHATGVGAAIISTAARCGAPSAFEDGRVAAAAHDRLIGDDDRRPRRDRVIDFRRKLRIHPQARRDFLGVGTAAAASHTHPTARLAARDQKARAAGRTFEQREHMIAERSASADLHPGAPDRSCRCDRRRSPCRRRSRPS